MLRHLLGVALILAAVGIMVFGGFYLFPGGNFALGLLAIIIGLGLLGVGAALLGPPTSPFHT
jgi:hypothetical protein